jgi:glycosyltransferase involved in cell wall biosynthesis
MTMKRVLSFLKRILFYIRYIQFLNEDLQRDHKKIRNDNRLKFSIILPTYNSPTPYFARLVNSIKKQTYKNFEVCISDDNSTNTKHIKYLKKLQKDKRFHIEYSTVNAGIAENSNKAIKKSSGDYVILCDHDDLISKFALAYIADHIARNPKTELLYTDEDLIDTFGLRFNPRCNPDWDPDLMLNHMYCPHIVCIKKELLDRTGLFNPELPGTQDWDLFLRLSEKANRIGHVPKILYSWRLIPGSISINPAEKLYAQRNGYRAITEALKRQKIEADTIRVPATNMGVYRIKRKVRDTSVSIVINSFDNNTIDLIQSISNFKTSGISIIIVSHNKDLILKSKSFTGTKFIYCNENASKAERYNLGAAEAQNENIIFIDDKIELADSDFPGALLEHTQRKEIGAVGCKLFYPNGNYYHTGIVLGVNKFAGFAHRNTQPDKGYYNAAFCIKNYSAVSWDLMATTKTKWNSVGGFDENLHSFSDVDFCLKLRKKELRTIYTPYVSGIIKIKIHNPIDLQDSVSANKLIERYGKEILNDPYYNPNLSKTNEDFSLDF